MYSKTNYNSKHIFRICLSILFLLFFYKDIAVESNLDISEIKHKPKKTYSHLNVTVTCYMPEKSQTDNTPLITASGKKINPSDPIRHRWCGISRDLKFKFGDTIMICGTGIYDGYWIVQDYMNARWKHKIDLLIGSDDYVSKWNNISLYYNF